MMFPVTAVLWRFLPKLQFMQFPWRWLLCLSMVFAIFVTVGVRKWWARAAICLTAILLIATAWHRIQSPWWDQAADLREMQDNMASDGLGYEGTDEYTPVGAEPSAVNKDDPRQAVVVGPAHAAIRVLHWGAESKTFTADMSAPDQLAVRLFPYPAWKVEADGRVVETAAREGTGQMVVPVEAGMNRIQITFVRTWDRRLGGWISVVTIILLLAWALIMRRRESGVGPRAPERWRPEVGSLRSDSES